MDILEFFHFDNASEKKAFEWFTFLNENKFDFQQVKKIDLTGVAPVIFDLEGNKFSIDFNSDKRNYHKKKASIKKEIIGRALGAGRYGLKVLDLSAGLGIDAIFVAQLGFQVTAIERNPLIFLALNEAVEKIESDLQVHFVFDSAQNYLNSSKNEVDVIYFDPMFPDKKKSALPRQEMVFFKNLVGNDSDADDVLALALKMKKAQRVVVKRPMKAPNIFKKPESKIEGKLIRFDIYGVQS